MLSLFNQKNNHETVANQQSNLDYTISANEARKLNTTKWTVLPTEDIFKKIKRRATDGFTEAYFFDAHINGLQLTMLKDLGYNVRIQTDKDKAPYFVVSW